MKVRRLIAVLLSILLCGCQSGSGLLAGKSFNDLPSVLNIYDTSAFLSGTNTSFGEIEAWNSYMSEKYGTQIRFNQVNSVAQQMDLQRGNLPGIIGLPAGSIVNYMETAEKEAYILPLDEYLKDNEIWKSLPQEFRNRFEWNGHIWAIPKNTSNTLQVTCVRTEWLTRAGVKLPTSLSELEAAGQQFMLKDANDNGLQDDYLLNFVLGENLCSAFGFYVNGYDPYRKTIVAPNSDSEEYHRFFDFVRTLYQEGLIDEASIMLNQPNTSSDIYGTIHSPLFSSKYGIAFQQAKEQGKTDEEILAIYEDLASAYEALPPLGEGTVQTYTDDSACFVLSKSTEQPKEVINTFVNIMFGSVEGNLDFKYGVPKNYQKGENKIIRLLYADAELKNYPAYPNLANNLDVLDSAWVTVTPGQNELLARKLKEDSQSYQKDYIRRYTKTGQLKKMPVWNYIEFKYNRYIGLIITTKMLETGTYYRTSNLQSELRYDQWKAFFGIS